MRAPWLPDESLAWALPTEVVDALAEMEQGPRGGAALVSYRCPAGTWTIGWGNTDDVHPGDTCSPQQADEWLCRDVRNYSKAVRDMCAVEPSLNELGAMTLLAYNIGLSGLRGSTVLRRHNLGDRQGAARAFGLWNKARDPKTGQLRELDGLSIRRDRESALYLRPGPGDAPARMPQAVAPESRMARSPINTGGAAVAGIGALEGVRQLGDSVGVIGAPMVALKGLLTDTIGLPPEWLLPVALAAAGGYVVWWRFKQRNEGYA